jgi:hypothetical protein
MRCENIKIKFPDFLVGDLEQEEKDEIQLHLAECASCREELENLSVIWTKLGVLPEEQPSGALRERFYGMLEGYKAEVRQGRTIRGIRKAFGRLSERFWGKRLVFQLAASLIPLVIGLIMGYFIKFGHQNTELRSEIQNVQQLLAVSLLEQRSPTERLRGINLSASMEKPSSQTIEALLNTLNNDPNINVRLAAVDALYLFYNYPSVKEGVIRSLSSQNSPLVQVALVDLLVTMRERQALESFKKLVQANELDPGVKQMLERGIQELSY